MKVRAPLRTRSLKHSMIVVIISAFASPAIVVLTYKDVRERNGATPTTRTRTHERTMGSAWCADPRQTGGGEAAASPAHARQESVPAVVVFPRKRPMHGTEPGPEEGVIELSLESLRYGRRHARTACVRTDTRLAPRVPLVTRPCRRWSETECSLALTVFQALIPDAAGGRGKEIGDCCLDAQSRVPAARYRAVALEKLEEAKV